MANHIGVIAVSAASRLSSASSAYQPPLGRSRTPSDDGRTIRRGRTGYRAGDLYGASEGRRRSSIASGDTSASYGTFLSAHQAASPNASTDTLYTDASPQADADATGLQEGAWASFKRSFCRFFCCYDPA